MRSRGVWFTSFERRRTLSRWAWGPCAGTTRGSTRARFRRRAGSRAGWHSAAVLFPKTKDQTHVSVGGIQSLLLEGGPTLAAAFLERGLVDKLLVFVAPKLSGEGQGLFAGLSASVALTHLEATRVGEDVLLSAYAHEP